MKIKFVGWFIEIEELYKYGVILGTIFNKYRFTKHENNFWIISECILQRKKWGEFSGNSLQELQIIPESKNFEVTFLKYKLFLSS